MAEAIIPGRPMGLHTVVATGDLAAAHTVTPPKGAGFVLVIAKTADIHFTVDGSTDPTSSVGIPVAAGDHKYIPCSPAKPLKFIRVASGAVLEYQFFSWK